MAHVRLFISAVSKEFLSYREVLRKALQRHDVTAHIQEDFIADGLPTLDKLDLYIRNCDGVIHLAGDMTGAMAKPASLEIIRKLCPKLTERIPEIKAAFDGGGLECSYTQWEAYLAVYHDKELLIAIPAEAAQREKYTYVKDPVQQAAQQAHLARLNAHERFPGVSFLDDRDLALGIYRSTLYDLMVKAGIESARALLDPPDAIAERRHREILEAVARDKRVDPKDLIPILENLGHQEPNISPADIPRRLSERVDALRAIAAEPLKASNEGQDIERVRQASRNALKDSKTDQALAILDRQLELEREAAEHRKRRMVTLLRDKADVERLRYDYAASRSTLEALLRFDPDDVRAWIGLGKDWQTIGSLKDARIAFDAALTAARRTGDQWGEGAALDVVGEALVAQGNLPEALKSFHNSLAIANSLVTADPSDAGLQRDLSVSHNKVGDVLVEQGNLTEAFKSFSDSLIIREWLAKTDSGNVAWQHELSVSYGKIGLVLFSQGKLLAALKSFRDGLAIMEHLVKVDPGNTIWQHDLSVSHERIGDILVAQGNLTDAFRSFRESFAVVERLTESNPGDVSWQRSLAVSYNKIGEVLVKQGNLTEALTWFRRGLAITTRLAKCDSENAGWQRDLSVSYERVGEVLVAQGDFSEALKSFRDSLAIRDYLAKSDPDNAIWQRDVAVSYNKIGDMQAAKGNLSEAIKSFRDSLVIRNRLATADPGNTGWQRDLSLCYNKVGDALMAQRNFAEAFKSFRYGLIIRDRLAEKDPSNANWQADLAASYERIGGVLFAEGNLAGALKSLRECLVIRDRLAKVDPDNAAWQADLAASHGLLGQLYVALDNKLEALRLFKAGRAIVAPQAERSGHQVWLGHLEKFDREIAALERP